MLPAGVALVVLEVFLVLDSSYSGRLRFAGRGLAMTLRQPSLRNRLGMVSKGESWGGLFGEEGRRERESSRYRIGLWAWSKDRLSSALLRHASHRMFTENIYLENSRRDSLFVKRIYSRYTYAHIN